MIRKNISLCFLLALAACTQAHLVSLAVPKATTHTQNMPSGTYTLDKSHASMTVRVSHLGLSNYTMQFTDFDATLEFDSQNPQKSSLKAIVYTKSIQTNYPDTKKKDFDAALAYQSKWFNAHTFPTATFISEKIDLTGEKSGIVHGKLTFLGITKPLSLHVDFNGSYQKKPFAGVAALGFSAKTTLKRSKWGLNTFIPAIGDDVDITMECEFHKT
ncbi:MAG: YceI family protein [Pseudomonadota bacterium]|nr:YceI family protein [Pseudomonadota bacterium]